MHPVKSGKYIRQANTNVFIDSQAKTSQKVTTDLNPTNPDRLLIEGETIRVTARDVVGVVKRFTNVANTQLVATDLNKLLEAGDIVTGDTSNATITDFIS